MAPPLRLVILVALATLFAPFPTVSAGSAQNPEIADPAGDVDPLGLAGLKPDQAQAIDSNATTYDLIAAYISAESRSGFLLSIVVRDLESARPPSDPTGTTPAMGTPGTVTYEAHFSTPTGAYLVRADIDVAIIAGATPTPVPFTNFTLHRDDVTAGGDTFITTLPGALQVPLDTILVWIPKTALGDPADGDTLNKFWVTSGHKGIIIDQAPDLQLTEVTPSALSPTAPAVPRPYGRDYTFGQYPGGAVQALSLTKEGLLEGTTTVGKPLTFYFKVENGGSSSDTISFTARAPRGWAAEFERATAELTSGSSEVLSVSLTPGEDAARTGLLRVRAVSLATGQSQEVSYGVFLDAPDNAGSGSTDGSRSNTDGGIPPRQSNDPTTAKDSPGVGAAMLGASLVAFAAFARSRRR